MAKAQAFNPKFDIPNLKGKVALVTGGKYVIPFLALAVLMLINIFQYWNWPRNSQTPRHQRRQSILYSTVPGQG